MIQWHSLFVLFTCTLKAVTTQEYYCLTGSELQRIEEDSEGIIITRRSGTLYYDNDQLCLWHIDAGPGKRLKIEVESSNLQWSPPNALCDGYDHVKFTEGDEILYFFCGYEYAKSIITKNQTIDIKFKTDETNPFQHNYEGVKLKFQVFNSSDCPPGWRDFNESCYWYEEQQENWLTAQQKCVLQQSNLISITSKEERDFITQELVSRGVQHKETWIGLNDIAVNRHFTWIDRSVGHMNNGLIYPTPHKFLHCVAWNSWKNECYIKACETERKGYLCKSKKGRTTDVYRVPQGKTNKGEGSSSKGRALLLGVLVPAVILLLAAVVAGICIHKRQTQRSRNSYRRGNETVSLRRQTNQRPSGSQMDAAPPSYKEAVRGPVLASAL